MSATLVQTAPQFRLDFNLAKAVDYYKKTNKTFVEGSLVTGAYNRSVKVAFECRLAENGVKRNEYDGNVSFCVPVSLDKAEAKALQILSNRMVEESLEQTRDDEDKWEFMPVLRSDRPWYMKIKMRSGKFVPVINGGQVNRDTYEHFGQTGDKVKVVGTFSIWMNPERGQFGLKFDPVTIDF